MEDKYEKMRNSILKNLQELSEFLVSEFGITNYYDLVDKMVDLYNFKVSVYEKNKQLFEEIEKEIKNF